jgi:hypothetical protein
MQSYSLCKRKGIDSVIVFHWRTNGYQAGADPFTRRLASAKSWGLANNGSPKYIAAFYSYSPKASNNIEDK